MDKWECDICGFVYNPIAGDPFQNIPTDTPFEELPDDWICPMCEVDKEGNFTKVENKR